MTSAIWNPNIKTNIWTTVIHCCAIFYQFFLPTTFFHIHIINYLFKWNNKSYIVYCTYALSFLTTSKDTILFYYQQTNIRYISFYSLQFNSILLNSKLFYSLTFLLLYSIHDHKWNYFISFDLNIGFSSLRNLNSIKKKKQMNTHTIQLKDKNTCSSILVIKILQGFYVFVVLVMK